jgi:hypothetical protein
MYVTRLAAVRTVLPAQSAKDYQPLLAFEVLIKFKFALLNWTSSVQECSRNNWRMFFWRTLPPASSERSWACVPPTKSTVPILLMTALSWWKQALKCTRRSLVTLPLYSIYSVVHSIKIACMSNAGYIVWHTVSRLHAWLMKSIYDSVYSTKTASVSTAEDTIGLHVWAFQVQANIAFRDCRWHNSCITRQCWSYHHWFVWQQPTLSAMPCWAHRLLLKQQRMHRVCGTAQQRSMQYSAVCY